jgi:hypothetical protein
MLFTIIGTLSHELGHIAVAKFFGYDTTLDYGSMNYYPKGFLKDEHVIKTKEISKAHIDVDYSEWPKELKHKVEALNEIIKNKYPYDDSKKTHDLWITLGGPSQTMFTSFCGLMLLYLRRKQWKTKFIIIDWLAVFMALFAMREIFNYVHALYDLLFNSESDFFGDEYRISRYLGFNEWVFPSLMFLLGLLISMYVIFKIIPLKLRFTFVIGGLLGGISGFLIWFGFLGEALF